MATEALAARGHEDIAMLSYDRSRDPTSAVSVAREAGYQCAMKRLGLERRTCIFRLSHCPGSREQELRDLIAQKDRPRDIRLVGSGRLTPYGGLP